MAIHHCTFCNTPIDVETADDIVERTKDYAELRRKLDAVRKLCVFLRDIPLPEAEVCEMADEGLCHWDARRNTAMDILCVLDGGGDAG